MTVATNINQHMYTICKLFLILRHFFFGCHITVAPATVVWQAKTPTVAVAAATPLWPKDVKTSDQSFTGFKAAGNLK